MWIRDLYDWVLLGGGVNDRERIDVPLNHRDKQALEWVCLICTLSNLIAKKCWMFEIREFKAKTGSEEWDLACREGPIRGMKRNILNGGSTGINIRRKRYLTIWRR